MKDIKALLIINVIAYAVFAFCTNEMDFTLWDAGVRVGLTITCVTAIVIYKLCEKENVKKN